MASIKKEMLRGVAFNAIARYSGIIIQLIVTAILARQLSPDEFGVASICTVVMTFFNLFTEMGVGIAIVQRQDLKEKDYNSIFSFSVYLTVFLTTVYLLAAYPIAHWYGNDSLVVYLHLLGISLFFATLNMVPNGLLLKAKRFGFIASRTLIIQILSGILSCLAAFNGFGIYALLISPILGSLLVFVVNYIQHPLRFSLCFEKTALKSIWSYSVYQFLFCTVNYFSRNMDKILTGKYLNMQQLGYYDKSYRVVLLPMQNISGVVNPVIQPVLAEYQNDRKRLGGYMLRILKIINLVCFPMSIVGFFTASETMILFFGDQWWEAVPCFRILCLSIGFQAANHITGAFFQVANSTKGLFWCGLVNSSVTIGSLLIALIGFRSINAVAASVSIAFAINYAFIYTVLFTRIYPHQMKDFIKGMQHPFLLSALLTIVFLVLGYFVSISNLVFSLAVKGIVALIVIIAYYAAIGFSPKHILHK